MFDLDTALAAWLRRYEYDRSLLPDDLRELERHVRDHVADLVGEGVDAETAFYTAVREFGDDDGLRAAYRGVFWGKLRRRQGLARHLTGEAAMLKNYLVTALRALLRHRGYTTLNVAGLALGLACCLLLFQYVAYETSYDTFHAKKDRLYRVAFETTRNGEPQGYGTTVGQIFGPTALQEVPGVARYARVHPNYMEAVLSYDAGGEDRTFNEPDVLFADSTFLDVFDYPLVQGDAARALREPGTMLLSQRLARKYFGEDDPIGKTIQFTGWLQAPYTVAGVFADAPAPTHLPFDVLLPMADLLADGRFSEGGAPWGWQNFITYLELEPTADAEAVEAQLTAMYLRHRGEDFRSRNLTADAYLQPLTDIHLNASIQGPATVMGDRRTVRFLTIIGLITLAIALVNYVNLATARALDRAKEVGVRKVVGARRTQLVGQFLMESALTNGLALVLAVALALLLLPGVNRVAGVEMAYDQWLDGWFWAAFLGIFGAATLLSGLYPAFVLSSFRPVTVLKGKAGALTSRAALRKALVVLQFAAAIALLAGTAIVYTQLRFMQSLDTGLDLEQVLVVENPRVRSEGGDRRAEMAALMTELRKVPAVQTIGLSQTTPGGGFLFSTNLYRADADPTASREVRATAIDDGFADVYGLPLVAGRGFTEGMTVPEDEPQPVIANEALIRTFGFASNEAALGARLTNGDGLGFVVRGVFEDFQWSSAHQEAEGMLFIYESRSGHVSMRVHAADLPRTLAAVEEAYRAHFPGNPFAYRFADAAFDEQYRADRRFATLFGAFAGIAVVISCLGLFGLASFTATRRTKEIGVRKVLGASASGIIALLARDFLVLVAAAFVVAVPVAYLVMRRWLDGFAYQIDLGPGVFLLAGAAALVVAFLAVSLQSIRAALADPVRSLRYE